MRYFFGFCLTAMLMSFGVAFADGFNIQSLPKGKEVTLPRPAITLVPTTEKIRLESTDMPQTLKLSHLGSPKPFKVAIFDKLAAHVKHIELKPGMTYLYNFKDLGAISIVPDAASSGIAPIAAQTLRIESNKPLSISR